MNNFFFSCFINNLGERERRRDEKSLKNNFILIKKKEGEEGVSETYTYSPEMNAHTKKKLFFVF